MPKCCARAWCKTPLVTLAREATARREVTDEYGSRAECESLMAEITRAQAKIQARANTAQEVKDARSSQTHRALPQSDRYLAARLSRSHLPKAIFSRAKSWAQAAARMPNVLAEDTWDLFRVLLR